MTYIYLAGPIAHAAMGGAGWRERVSGEFGDRAQFLDPLNRWNAVADDLEIVDGHCDEPGHVGVRDIVEGDLNLLELADGVLVGYSQLRSVGTPMEVRWAHERDVPVALWIRDETPVRELSPWYRYHAGIVTESLDLAVGYLVDGTGSG
jgi:hypothetical protein